MKYLIIILLLIGFKSQSQTLEQIHKFSMFVDSMNNYSCLFRCERPGSKKRIIYLTLKYKYQDSASKYYNAFPKLFIDSIDRILLDIPYVDTCKCN